MNNQECKIRPEVININSNKPVFHPYSILINKCSGSCNNINDPYPYPDVVKNMNITVFNLISRINETRHISWDETCKCKFTSDANVCKFSRRWDKNKCRCECKELIDKGSCDKGINWNPITYECECDKLCEKGQYLDYKHCKCK